MVKWDHGALTHRIGVVMRKQQALLSLPTALWSHVAKDGSHLHARKSAFTRNRISWHHYLGLPRLQNCGKINGCCLLIQRIIIIKLCLVECLMTWKEIYSIVFWTIKMYLLIRHKYIYLKLTIKLNLLNIKLNWSVG